MLGRLWPQTGLGELSFIPGHRGRLLQDFRFWDADEPGMSNSLNS